MAGSRGTDRNNLIHSQQGHSCRDCNMAEFNLCAVFGFCDSPEEHTNSFRYEVGLAVQRPIWGNNLWTFAVQAFLVFSATFSFWDIADAALSSSLGITLTVALTFAAYTSERPQAISTCLDTTFQDMFEDLEGFWGLAVPPRKVNRIALSFTGVFFTFGV